MEQQRGIRRRLTHILTYSIRMCRSKQSADSPIHVSREPTTPLPSRVRKPRLADLFSADSDTAPRCAKIDSDKAERAIDGKLEDGEVKTTPSHADYNYYRKSCNRRKQSKSSDSKPARNSSSDSTIGNEPENHTKNYASGKRSKYRYGRRRRRRSEREVFVKKRGGGSSVAVAKRSVDPYEDFKMSMVEMIVEKEIFGREELEDLLISFLGLNSPHHHKIIVLVFVDILQVLFSQ